MAHRTHTHGISHITLPGSLFADGKSGLVRSEFALTMLEISCNVMNLCMLAAILQQEFIVVPFNPPPVPDDELCFGYDRR